MGTLYRRSKCSGMGVDLRWKLHLRSDRIARVVVSPAEQTRSLVPSETIWRCDTHKAYQPNGSRRWLIDDGTGPLRKAIEWAIKERDEEAERHKRLWDDPRAWDTMEMW